jgi:hypothetical protein
MANRYPLVLDTADKKLKELPIGDNLRIDGDIIINNGEIKINGESLTIDYSQVLNSPTIPNDISDLSDDNNLLVISELTGVRIFGLNNTLLVDGINNSIPYNVLVNTPFIPTDISELTDNQGLLGDGSTITSSNGLTQLTRLTTAERDELTPLAGDIIYNISESSVQVYVDIVDWSSDPIPEPIPGWTNLYTAPVSP